MKISFKISRLTKSDFAEKGVPANAPTLVFKNMVQKASNVGNFFIIILCFS